MDKYSKHIITTIIIVSFLTSLAMFASSLIVDGESKEEWFQFAGSLFGALIGFLSVVFAAIIAYYLNKKSEKSKDNIERVAILSDIYTQAESAIVSSTLIYYIYYRANDFGKDLEEDALIQIHCHDKEMIIINSPDMFKNTATYIKHMSSHERTKLIEAEIYFHFVLDYSRSMQIIDEKVYKDDIIKCMNAVRSAIDKLNELKKTVKVGLTEFNVEAPDRDGEMLLSAPNCDFSQVDKDK